ncbi:MAG: tRNA (cytidine(56)-2'-O)-methyltransferase [Candidatus Aenigmarchaeota archaeon]|nr:tRNA (cytidine(56)-2'-O)-methyltransferase [Candidatus Aenigmarchaeota archaeon]
MTIVVLRLGHRRERDARLSTHCGLVARALGADKIIFSGEPDQQLLESIKNVTKRWGGPFRAEYNESWRSVIKNAKKKKFSIVHLSMYGIPFQKHIRKIRKSKNTLLIIGSEKVPGEVYQLSDYNLAVTNQPHSEAAALAIFLNSVCKEKKFKSCRIKIVPQERGKKVIEK